jgi:methylglutaconyl-CoA hydratase
LDATIDSIKDNNKIRCVLFRSLVPNVFCAGKFFFKKRRFNQCFFYLGADLKERLNMPQEEVGPFVSKIKEIFSKIFAIPVPTIAALDGKL